MLTQGIWEEIAEEISLSLDCDVEIPLGTSTEGERYVLTAENRLNGFRWNFHNSQ